MINSLRTSAFLRAVLLLTSGTVMAQVIPFVLTPLLTRIYTVDELGVLTLYTSFLAVFYGTVSLGFKYSIVSADENDVLGIIALSLRCIAIVSLPVCILAYVIIRYNFLGFGAVSRYLVVSVFLALVIGEITDILRYVALRNALYRDLTLVSVSQSLGRSSAHLALGLIGMGWWGLTLGDAFGRVLGGLRLWRSAPYKLKDLIYGWSWQRLKPLVQKYQDYAKYSTPGAVIDSLSAQIVAPLLTAEFGLFVAGQYGIVSRLVLLPVSLVGRSVADVFHQRLADAAENSPGSSTKLFLAVAAGLLFMGVGLIGFIVILGDAGWVMLLGDEWSMAGQYAVAIAPRAAVLLVVSPLSQTVLVYGGQKSKLIYNIFSVILVISAIQLASRLNWDSVHTVTLVSWTQAGAGLVYFLLLLNMVRGGSEKATSINTH